MSIDFGFDRFLERFEGRFGRVATTILIGTVGAALFIYSAHIVIKTLKDFSEEIQSLDWTHSEVIAAITSEAIAVLICIPLGLAFFSTVYRYYFTPKIEGLRGRLRESLKKAEQLSIDYEQLRTDYERLEGSWINMNSRADRLEKEIIELKAMSSPDMDGHQPPAG